MADRFPLPDFLTRPRGLPKLVSQTVQPKDRFSNDPFMRIQQIRQDYQDAYRRSLSHPAGSINHTVALTDLKHSLNTAQRIGLHPLFIERWQEIVEANYHDQ